METRRGAPVGARCQPIPSLTYPRIRPDLESASKTRTPVSLKDSMGMFALGTPCTRLAH